MKQITDTKLKNCLDTYALFNKKTIRKPLKGQPKPNNAKHSEPNIDVRA